MIPEGYHSVTPSLTAADAAAALDFYTRAFGATEHYRLEEPGTGKIMHGEFSIGNSRIMISSEYPAFGSVAPEIGKGASFMIYVEDVDAAFKKAVAEGGIPVQEPTDQFWGDRSGRINDPHGYRWSLATHVRDVSPEEIAKAAASWGSSQS